MIPIILIGIGMRLQIVSVGIEPALWLVLVGQTLYVLPLAVINLKIGLIKYQNQSKRLGFPWGQINCT